MIAYFVQIDLFCMLEREREREREFHIIELSQILFHACEKYKSLS